MQRTVLSALAALALPAGLWAQEAEPPTPASIVAAAAPGEWRAIPPNDLLVIDLAPDSAGRPRQVVIQLIPPPFSTGWVENVRTLARAHWWDEKSVYRVVDNFVAQWGAGEDEEGQAVALPDGLRVVPESEYTTTATAIGMADASPADPADDVMLEAQAAANALSDALDGDFGAISLEATRSDAHPEGWHEMDPYAPWVEFREGWPLAAEQDGEDWRFWPVHCYATVGVARDLSPDTGTGAELYAVIGHAPRPLDRNIAIVGRVIDGIEHLATLPRGTGDAGVYASEAERTPIVSARLASELPPAERPLFEYLASDSESFERYVAVRANRQDAFYRVPAGGVDICNVPVPVRRITPG